MTDRDLIDHGDEHLEYEDDAESWPYWEEGLGSGVQGEPGAWQRLKTWIRFKTWRLRRTDDIPF